MSAHVGTVSRSLLAISLTLACAEEGGHGVPDVEPAVDSGEARGVDAGETDHGAPGEGDTVAHPWEDDALVVMSFNVMCSMCSNDQGGNEPWAARVPHFADIIQRHAPDLIGLQELTFASEVDEILAVVPAYQAIYPRDLSPNLFGWTDNPDATILYRADRFTVEQDGAFWLSETPDEDWSGGWADTNLPRVLVWARLRQVSDGRELWFATTHFDNNPPNQENSAPLVLDRLEPGASDAPVILVGDFNSRPDTVAYATLTLGEGGQGFHVLDSFDLAEAWSAETNLEPPPGYDPTHRIDHIFVAGAAPWGCGRWTVDQTVYGPAGQFPSDHRPILAHLAW
ncbi:MAG: endonuclease/exonuclease/phosphatase family protein [Deltaproteobacteria bacterium]|nr:endonuclease/exonuclease/phosphatase family protein [Deltaproteobacteria bacterium]